MIGSEIVEIGEVNSTNSFVAQLLDLKQKLRNGSVYITNNQLAGKGQGENIWETEAGKNLTFTIYLEPGFLDPSDQFYLNKAISLGIQIFLSSLLTEKVHIKWPNDIYITNKKVAGILINHTIIGKQLKHSIIGIGLNVNQTHFVSDAPNPASIIHFTKKEWDLEKTLHRLLGSIHESYHLLRNNDFEFLTKQYYDAMLGYQEWRDYLYQNQQIKAKITGVSSFGTLLLTDDHGHDLECGFKEIEFIV
jgi:BirA family biotin operon repressor/biotin-[acetyl-CoA-carboxylase] ligase